jgi:hypothetical protein
VGGRNVQLHVRLFLLNTIDAAQADVSQRDRA